MSLSAAFLDELRERTILSSLIGRSIRLQKAGNEWKACCPFHNEKSPSFYVNDDKAFAHCFGCSWHGDAIKWLVDHRGLEFLGAVRELADAAGMQMPEREPVDRLRMVAASFLVKDLLVDWRWGERYFAEQLIDFDLSANNGGWQWAASTGCDAQPWFRIFNPVTQSEKFDPQGKFIRKYVPELAACDDKEIHVPWLIAPLRQQALGLRIGHDYPQPVVDHALQRLQTLALYKRAGAEPGA